MKVRKLWGLPVKKVQKCWRKYTIILVMRVYGVATRINSRQRLSPFESKKT